jgi:Uma2 family endonuclease
MATTVLTLAPNLDQPVLPPSADGRLRFSREAYHRLVDVGILNSDSRVELIDGEIYMMSPIGPLHSTLVRRLTYFFIKELPESIECSAQLPFYSGEHSEPEPDVTLVRRRDDGYQHEHPSPGDVLLVIEVAQSSLEFDLGRKLQLYASSGIPEYWVIDVNRRQVFVHRDPAGNQYRNVTQCHVGDRIAPLAAANCELDIAWLFR